MKTMMARHEQTLGEITSVHRRATRSLEHTLEALNWTLKRVDNGSPGRALAGGSRFWMRQWFPAFVEVNDGRRGRLPGF
jgi:hypothetical protein